MDWRDGKSGYGLIPICIQDGYRGEPRLGLRRRTSGYVEQNRLKDNEGRRLKANRYYAADFERRLSKSARICFRSLIEIGVISTNSSSFM